MGGEGVDVLYGGSDGLNLDRASWRTEKQDLYFDFTSSFTTRGNLTSDAITEDLIYEVEGWEGSRSNFNTFDATDATEIFNFFGGDGGNLIIGGNGGDGAGAGLGDGLIGFQGNDTIIGNEGGDIIWGRRGDDYLDAGLNLSRTDTDGDADQFNFERLSGNDVIVNFEVGLDFVVMRENDVDDQDGIAGITADDLIFSTVNAGGDAAVDDTKLVFETTGTGANPQVFRSEIIFYDVDQSDLKDNGVFLFF
ncbi:MAG: hypothetical protein AAGJ28_00300 [Pseudomonadota bacterium]